MKRIFGQEKKILWWNFHGIHEILLNHLLNLKKKYQKKWIKKIGWGRSFFLSALRGSSFHLLTQTSLLFSPRISNIPRCREKRCAHNVCRLKNEKKKRNPRRGIRRKRALKKIINQAWKKKKSKKACELTKPWHAAEPID